MSASPSTHLPGVEIDASPAPSGAVARRRRAWIRSSVVAVTLFLGGCAATPFVTPPRFDDSALRARATTAEDDEVRVSVTVPSVDEARDAFGIDLSSKGIQPLWLEIENRTGQPLLFFPTGLDPEYFAPHEVAFLFSGSMSDDARRALDDHIQALNFTDPVPPDATVSGFVYTNHSRGSKFVNIDLVRKQWTKGVTLVAAVPGSGVGDEHYAQIIARLSDPDAVRVEDEGELRRLLESLPCCASSADGALAEPLNIALVGDIEDISPAFTRRGYRFSPATPRVLFGRPQDISARKEATWVAAQPHLIRVWATTIRYRGKAVWIGQITSPLGGRFAVESAEGPMEVEPDVDRARIDLAQDMIYSQSLVKLGHVTGAGRVGRPGTETGGARYHTDGLRVVLMFEVRPVSLDEIELLGWERLADHR